MSLFGSLIGAGTQILGGLLGSNSQKDAEKAAARQRQKEYQQQKEFAQSGIQWRVKDAKKAGIHPLYAIGANTTSYSPQSIGTGPGTDFSFLGDAGQNIGRAIDSTRSNAAKADALALTASQIQLEGLRLDNDLKRAQLASSMSLINQTGISPGLPTASTAASPYGMPGQGNTPQIDGPGIRLEKKISPAAAGAHNQEYGEIPEVQFLRTPTGWAPAIPEQLSEAFEQDRMGRWQWNYRNRIAPVMYANDGSNPYFRPPQIPLDHGQRWKYNFLVGEWQIVPGFRDHWLRR